MRARTHYTHTKFRRQMEEDEIRMVVPDDSINSIEIRIKIKLNKGYQIGQFQN